MPQAIWIIQYNQKKVVDTDLLSFFIFMKK